eukprot:6261691-Pyramimonas_sp.AAC.1
MDEDVSAKLDEDRWYLLSDEPGGAEPRGKLNGLHAGNGLMAYQESCRLYSSVTAATVLHRMHVASNPKQPRQMNEVAMQLEQWRASVESLEGVGLHICILGHERAQP